MLGPCATATPVRHLSTGRRRRAYAPIDVNESLAEAVCCDKRALPFAEPQFLYKEPDVGCFAT